MLSASLLSAGRLGPVDSNSWRNAFGGACGLVRCIEAERSSVHHGARWGYRRTLPATVEDSLGGSRISRVAHVGVSRLGPPMGNPSAALGHPMGGPRAVLGFPQGARQAYDQIGPLRYLIIRMSCALPVSSEPRAVQQEWSFRWARLGSPMVGPRAALGPPVGVPEFTKDLLRGVPEPRPTWRFERPSNRRVLGGSQSC